MVETPHAEVLWGTGFTANLWWREEPISGPFRVDASLAGSRAEPKTSALAGSRSLQAPAHAPLSGNMLICFWGANAGRGGRADLACSSEALGAASGHTSQMWPQSGGWGFLTGAGLSRGTIAMGGGSPHPDPDTVRPSWGCGVTLKEQGAPTAAHEQQHTPTK